MRFFDQILQVAGDETAKGHIVLAPFPAIRYVDGQANGMMLNELHREKIRMCSQVIVVTDQDGYVGDATRREMDYGRATSKDMDVRKFHIKEVAL
jgi:hypothetical protein